MPRGFTKFYLTVAVGLGLVLVLAILLIFGDWEDKRIDQTGNLTTDNSQGRQLLKESVLIKIEQENLKVEEKQAFREMTNEFFLKIEEAEKIAKKSQEEPSEISPAPDKRISPVSQMTILDKSAQKVFPAHYLEIVQSVAASLKQEGFVPADKEVRLEKTKDVLGVLENLLDYLRQSKLISEEEYSEGHYGLTVILPRTLESDFGNSSLKKLTKNIAFGSSEHNFFLNLLFSIIEFPKKAFAACFWPGAPAPGGFVAWAPYCWDPGPGIGFGCIDDVCHYKPSLWDSMTRICGCG